jgi:redox-sensitive bicupin YhaK (pirin superfamily)
MPSSVEHIIRARPRDLGGFMVRRVLPAFEKQMVGPFIFVDHMGPISFEPRTGIDVRPHPHIGLATVTYLFEGKLVHRDSLGSVQPIRPGDVNWMVAGRGIAHSERTPPELRSAGSSAHGVQTWVALPKAREETEPTFAHHATATLPLIDLPGATVRVIAGHAFGKRAPVEVFTDTLDAAVDLAAGASMMLEPEHEERGVYVVDGAVTVGGTAVDAGTLAILAAGQPVEISAHVSSRSMLLGGAKMDGPRFIWWNFVSSSKERIERAKAEWREDRFARIPGETERIPLPDG